MRSSVYPQNVVKGAALAVNGKTQFSKEFPMGPGYYQVNLRLNIGVVIGTGAGPVAEGELNFLRQISLRTSLGENIINNVPARALFKAAIFKSSIVPRKDAIAAATATYRIDIPIYFADPLTARPEDTVLVTSRYTAITMDLLLGPLTDLFTAPGTAAVTVTADIDIIRSKARWPDEAGVIGYPQYTLLPLQDASAGTAIDLERSTDLRYKRLFVHNSASGTAGQPWFGANADDVMDVVNLFDSDDNFVKDQTWAMLQDDNKQMYGIETVPAGVMCIDFCRDRSNLSALYSGDKSMLRLSWTNQAGVGANDIVTVLAEGFRTLRSAA